MSRGNSGMAPESGAPPCGEMWRRLWDQCHKAPAPHRCLEILRSLRSVFEGLAARHDATESRVIVYEESHRDKGGGPAAEKGQYSSFSSCPIREPEFREACGDALEAVIESRPWLQVQTNSAGDPCGYEEPGLGCWQMAKTGQATEGFRLFKSAAQDAGFALLGVFATHCGGLRHPDLVPPSFFSDHSVVTSSTGLPTGLDRRWLLFLHLLGWQQLHDSPIRAQRFVWEGISRVMFGEIEELRGQMFPDGNGFDWLAKLRMPPPFFGSDLAQDINLASVYAIDAILSGALAAQEADCMALLEQLERIRPGKAGAASYHTLAFQILEALFRPSLRDGKKEAATDGGRARIDIVFENRAEDGFLYDLRFQHGIKCPFVFFECKNYADDIRNPEFAQLYSRLDDDRGRVGFLVCRRVRHPQSVSKRCQDYLAKGVLLLVLTDADLAEMLRAKADGNMDSVWSVLRRQARSIILRSAG